jgi:hypothetical protein
VLIHLSTLFTEIYEQNELIRNDNRIQLKPTNQIYKLYYDYLKDAIGLFFRDCYKDLTDNIPFNQVEYNFISNGTDNQYLLQSPSVPLTDGLFYVGYTSDSSITYTEINASNYNYNSSTNVLTITSPSQIPQNNIVYIASYVIGQFNQDLSYDEIMILSNGMLIPFLQEQQNRNSLLTQMVYGGESKIYAQSSHIDSVHNVSEDQYDKVISMINLYSYKANPNNLKDLGGNAIYEFSN